MSDLADEQAALRRVATLVAERVPAEDLFAAMVRELGQLLDVDFVHMTRVDAGGVVTVVGGWSRSGDHFPAGTQNTVDRSNVIALVARSGAPARIDTYDNARGPLAATMRSLGFRSSAAAPIVVDGRPWGVMIASSRAVDPLPPDTEARITAFTELAATAISNTEAWAQTAALANEQAALRRVATLVASDVAPSELFAAVAREVGSLLGGDFAGIARFDGDAVVGLGGWAADGEFAAYPERWPMHEDDPASRIAATNEPVTVPDWDGVPGAMAAYFRDELGSRSAVGTPIVVNGRLWGAMVLQSKQPMAFPAGTESRMAQFTDLIATAIADAQARSELSQLAEEQAALRRVATLVASDVAPGELFAAVAREVGSLLGGDLAGIARFDGDTVEGMGAWAADGEHPPYPERWPMNPQDPAGRIAATRQSVTIEDWTGVPGPMAAMMRDDWGVRSSLGTPIVVKGRLWGAIALHSKRQAAFPADTESRMAQFTDLIATAVAGADARGEVVRLAEEQAALRRVATLVAQEASRDKVFSAIGEEIAARLSAYGGQSIRMMRYEDGSALVLAAWGDVDDATVPGMRLALGGRNVMTRVYETRATARIDDYDATGTGDVAEKVRGMGFDSIVGAPITVQDRVWGSIIAASRARLPAETEQVLSRFTDLLATAIANTEARGHIERLAAEHAALRRVATLVAEEAAPEEVFGLVAEEVATLIDAADCAIYRDERDGTGTLVALHGERGTQVFSVGDRLPADGDGLAPTVLREQRPVRVEDYAATSGAIAERGRELGVRTGVGCPIVVRGRVWGVIVVVRYVSGPFPRDTESRLAQFADLIATAVANSAARTEVERLAGEQAGLRRVATLVAEGASATAVFDCVAAEVRALLDAGGTVVLRYESDSEVTVMAHRAGAEDPAPGTRTAFSVGSIEELVHRTQRSGRIDDELGRGDLAELATGRGVRTLVGTPIVVDGRLWGLVAAGWHQDQPPPDTEQRMTEFAQLLGTAIANADGRDQLIASRARLVATADDVRRRVVRDLHDGAQQRLVHTIITLKQAHRALQPSGERAAELVAEALEQAQRANVEVRELAHGILPAVLTHGGLPAGVEALVSRAPVPVATDVSVDRLPGPVEATAYFVIAETLTNVAKHARATRATVGARVQDGTLRREVRDDGVGGARPDGSGLVGLADRLAVLNGRLRVDSPAGGGTVVAAEIPVPA